MSGLFTVSSRAVIGGTRDSIIIDHLRLIGFVASTTLLPTSLRTEENDENICIPYAGRTAEDLCANSWHSSNDNHQGKGQEIVQSSHNNLFVKA